MPLSEGGFCQRLTLFFAVATCLLFQTPRTDAQSYPSRPIRIIVPASVEVNSRAGNRSIPPVLFVAADRNKSDRN